MKIYIYFSDFILILYIIPCLHKGPKHFKKILCNAILFPFSFTCVLKELINNDNTTPTPIFNNKALSIYQLKEKKYKIISTLTCQFIPENNVGVAMLLLTLTL